MTTRFTRLATVGAAGLLAMGIAAPAAAQDKVSIEMIQSGYTERMQPYFDDLSQRFMEANPDIEVAVQVVSWNDIYDVLNTRVASGDPPDIMNLNYFANFAADDLLYKADEIVSPEVLESFVQTFRDNSKYEGVEYAVATLGTATTALHVQKLMRQVDEVIFCFDGDDAGRRAAWRALEQSLGILSDGKQVRFLFLPQGEDPDTYVRKAGKAAFEALAKEAPPLSRCLLEELTRRVDLTVGAALKAAAALGRG